MTKNKEKVNTNMPTVAPLSNVGLCAGAIDRTMNRPSYLHGMLCFFGPSGWGKTTAAAYCAARYRAYSLSIKELQTRKGVLLDLCTEIGISSPPKNAYEIYKVVCEQLAINNRPIILDEFDFLVDRKAVEFIRNLHDDSGATIMLIGEEALPKKLERWERLYSRILDFIPAQPPDLEDAMHLARLHYPDVSIHRDLVQKAQKASKNSIRRIVTNLYAVYEEAKLLGLKEIGLNQWGDHKFPSEKEQTTRRIR